MIEYNDNGYVVHEKLDRSESLMFAGFLEQEKVRHQADIDKIQSTLDYLRKKFPNHPAKEQCPYPGTICGLCKFHTNCKAKVWEYREKDLFRPPMELLGEMFGYKVKACGNCARKCFDNLQHTNLLFICECLNNGGKHWEMQIPKIEEEKKQ